MFKAENVRDIYKHLDEVVCPTVRIGEVACEHPQLSRPVYLMYDRMCQLTLSFGPGNLLAQYSGRWYNGASRTRHRVDRFHYASHSRDDQQCRCAGRNEAWTGSFDSLVLNVASHALDSVVRSGSRASLHLLPAATAH